METFLSELRERDYIVYERVNSWYELYTTTYGHNVFCKLYGFLFGCMYSGVLSFERMSELSDELIRFSYKKN